MVSIGIFPFAEECLFLLWGEESEFSAIKPEGVVTPHLFAILQGRQFCVRVMISFLVLLFILMFAILVLFGCGLLDPPCVFIGIASIWVLLEDFFLQFRHGIKMSAIWVSCSSVDTGVHVFWTWVVDLAEQILNFSRLVDDAFCAATESGMSTVHFVFKFGPTHVRGLFSLEQHRSLRVASV